MSLVDIFNKVPRSLPCLLLSAGLTLLALACGGGGDSGVAQPPATGAVTLSSVVPSSGPPGTEVVITGTQFDQVTEVRYGGTALPPGAYDVDSPTRIRLRIPAGAASGIITLATATTKVDSPPFTVADPGDKPTLATMTPASGPAGTEVTFKGTHFDRITGVAYGGTPLAAGGYDLDSPTRIRARVPLGAASGVFTLMAATGDLYSPAFTVSAPIISPTLTTMAPASGLAGTEVTFTGAQLDRITGVAYGGIPLAAGDYDRDSPTRIRARVPLGAASGVFTLMAATGDLYSPAFTVSALVLNPTLATMAPASGLAGTEVTFTGAQLDRITGVAYGGIPLAAGDYDRDSPTRIRARVPLGAASGVFTLMAATGDLYSPAFNVSALVLNPILATMTPTSGPAGTEVTFTGTHFDWLSGVAYGGTPLAAGGYDRDSPTQLRARVPLGAASGVFTLLAAAGNLDSPAFTVVLPVPALSAMAPLAGSPTEEVTLTGVHLDRVTGVTYAGMALDPGTLHQDSPTQIRARVPLRATAAGSFDLTWAGGTLSSPAFNLAFQAPTVAAVAPGAATTGTDVVITGTHLSSATQVTFRNNVPAVFTVQAPDRIVATVPVGARTGPIRVITRGGNVLSPADFQVVPVITSIAPVTGAPGSEVVLTGTGMTTYDAHVRFGNTWTQYHPTATPDGTSLRVRVPTGAAPGPVTLITNGGMAHSAQAFTVVYAPPTLTAMAPVTGVPGIEVTLTGTDLDGVSEVLYAGVPLFPGSWSLDVNHHPGRIKAIVPVHAASGVFTLRTPAGASVDSGLFTVTPLASRSALLDQPLVRGPFGTSLEYPAISRTRQYGVLDFPKTPIFHTYHPFFDDGTPLGQIRPGFGFPQFALNLGLPAATFQEVVSAPVQAQATTLAIPANLMEIRVVSQNQPYLGTMLFRPLYWLFPGTPYRGMYTEQREAGMGLYQPSAGAPIHFVGHPAGAYLTGPDTNTIVHPVDASTEPPPLMISSPNNLPVAGLDFNLTRTVWSLVHDRLGPILPGRSVETLHLMLNDADHDALTALVLGAAPGFTYRNLLQGMAGDLTLVASPAFDALRALVSPRIATAVLGPVGMGGVQALTLTGSGFSAVPLPAVTVDGTAATAVTVVSDAQITATVTGLAIAPTHNYAVLTEPFLEGTATL